MPTIDHLSSALCMFSMILLCARARNMSCALPISIMCSHAMIPMTSSSVLHLRSTSLHDLIAMLSHVASNSWITCSSHMFGCNNVIPSHMPCPIACHMIDLIASHMMNNCSFDCVECHSIFTTPYAHYAWIVLHLTHVFRHLIFLGVVNDSYAYHRPFIEKFVNACYELEVDAYSIVTHICITTSHLHACCWES